MVVAIAENKNCHDVLCDTAKITVPSIWVAIMWSLLQYAYHVSHIILIHLICSLRLYQTWCKI